MDEPMDKTTRLIKWQRLTIAVLVFALTITTLAASYHARMSEARWQESQIVRERVINRGVDCVDHEAILKIEKTISRDAGTQYSQDKMNSLVLNQMLIEARERNESDQRIIRDAVELLDKYQAKYGPIGPRKGEGVYLGKLALKHSEAVR